MAHELRKRKSIYSQPSEISGKTLIYFGILRDGDGDDPGCLAQSASRSQVRLDLSPVEPHSSPMEERDQFGSRNRFAGLSRQGVVESPDWSRRPVSTVGEPAIAYMPDIGFERDRLDQQRED